MSRFNFAVGVSFGGGGYGCVPQYGNYYPPSRNYNGLNYMAPDRHQNYGSPYYNAAYYGGPVRGFGIGANVNWQSQGGGVAPGNERPPVQAINAQDATSLLGVIAYNADRFAKIPVEKTIENDSARKLISEQQLAALKPYTSADGIHLGTIPGEPIHFTGPDGQQYTLLSGIYSGDGLLKAVEEKMGLGGAHTQAQATAPAPAAAGAAVDHPVNVTGQEAPSPISPPHPPATVTAAPADAPAHQAPAAAFALPEPSGTAAKLWAKKDHTTFDHSHAPKIDASQVEAVQKYLGVQPVDGKWGPDTQAAFEKVAADAGVNPREVDFTKKDNAPLAAVMKHLGAASKAPAAAAAPAPVTPNPAGDGTPPAAPASPQPSGTAHLIKQLTTNNGKPLVHSGAAYQPFVAGHPETKVAMHAFLQEFALSHMSEEGQKAYREGKLRDQDIVEGLKKQAEKAGVKIAGYDAIHPDELGPIADKLSASKETTPELMNKLNVLLEQVGLPKRELHNGQQPAPPSADAGAPAPATVAAAADASLAPPQISNTQHQFLQDLSFNLGLKKDGVGVSDQAVLTYLAAHDPRFNDKAPLDAKEAAILVAGVNAAEVAGKKILPTNDLKQDTVALAQEFTPSPGNIPNAKPQPALGTSK